MDQSGCQDNLSAGGKKDRVTSVGRGTCKSVSESSHVGDMTLFTYCYCLLGVRMQGDVFLVFHDIYSSLWLLEASNRKILLMNREGLDLKKVFLRSDLKLSNVMAFFVPSVP